MSIFDLIVVIVAKYLIVVPFVVAAVYFFQSDAKTRKRMVIVGILGCGLAFVLSRIASTLYYDPRPFVVRQIEPLIAHAADNGFPSDHALLSFSLAALMYVSNKRWGIALGVVAVAIGAARVFAHVHSWIDIGGSFVISAVSIYVVELIVRRLSSNNRLARWMTL